MPDTPDTPDAREALEHTIATICDYPSVYMGGPSHHSRRTAAEIMHAIDDAGWTPPTGWTHPKPASKAQQAAYAKGLKDAARECDRYASDLFTAQKYSADDPELEAARKTAAALATAIRALIGGDERG